MDRFIASAIDLLNTWAREKGIREIESDVDIRILVNDLQARTASEAIALKAENERLRDDARELNQAIDLYLNNIKAFQAENEKLHKRIREDDHEIDQTHKEIERLKKDKTELEDKHQVLLKVSDKQCEAAATLMDEIDRWKEKCSILEETERLAIEKNERLKKERDDWKTAAEKIIKVDKSQASDEERKIERLEKEIEYLRGEIKRAALHLDSPKQPKEECMIAKAWLDAAIEYHDAARVCHGSNKEDL